MFLIDKSCHAKQDLMPPDFYNMSCLPGEIFTPLAQWNEVAFHIPSGLNQALPLFNWGTK